MPKSFDSAKDVPDLQGKVILVTGANSGIGEATVRALAPHNPKSIYLCARRTSTGDEVISSIHKEHPNAKIEVLELDLDSFDSIKKCAANFNADNDHLDILFLNAGIGGAAPRLTKEGYEAHIGVNHMGHALLTQLLLPKMLQTARNGPDADVRIILTSSVAASNFAPKSGLALDQMKTACEGWAPTTRYGHSKLANILFAQKLAQLYPAINSTSYHPGLVKTEIWGKTDLNRILTMLLTPLVWMTGVTSDEGAKTGLWCATAGKGPGGVESGKFYFPIGLEKDDKNIKNTKLRDELWQWTNDELSKHGAPGWPDA